MKPNRRVFVVGGAHSKFVGRGSKQTLEDHLGAAIRGAFESTGVPAEAIERGYVANFLGECFAGQGHLGAMAAAVDPALTGKPFLRIEAACASGAAAVTSAVDALQGSADVALVAGAEVECNVRGRDAVEYMARACHYEDERGLSQFTFPYLFARRAKAYKEKFDVTREDVGAVVVKAYDNAADNPMAQMHGHRVTLDQVTAASEENYEFLEDAALAPHMRHYDCTHFTDGASAVIVATERGLEKLGKTASDATEILSYGFSVAPLSGVESETSMVNMARAAHEAYRDAGVAAKDVRVAEVHDCFSITELLIYEALGFAEEGHAKRLVRDGITRRDGQLPVNTGGGLLAFGHPIGATGVKQVLEVHKQLRGSAGAYQVDADLGLTANLGGNDKTGVVMLLR